MRLFLLTGLAVITGWCCPAVAGAQVSFGVGPQVGYSLSSASYAAQAPGSSPRDSYTSSGGIRHGLEAGVKATLRLGHLAVQPALLYSQRGYRFTDAYVSSYEARTDRPVRLSYLTLPVQVAYSLRADGQGWQVSAGPYVGLLLGGSYEERVARIDQFGYPSSVETRGDVKAGDFYAVSARNPFGPVDPTIYHRRLDVGLQAGVGYQLGQTLLQATYSLGLSNINAQNPNSVYGARATPAIKNRTFGISAAYLFGF